MSTPEKHDHPDNEPRSEISSRENRGSLRSKLVLSLGAMFLVFLVVDEVVRQRVIKPSFVRLENAEAIRDADRVLAAINVEAEYLAEIGEQLAARVDPAAMTIAGDIDRFEDTNGNASRTQRVAWLAVVGTDASWHWLHRGPALDAIEDEAIVIPDVAELTQDTVDATFHGTIRFDNSGLFMFAGAPIANRDVGHDYFLVVGRALDNEMVRAISKRTQVQFSLQQPRQSRHPDRYDVWEADRETLVVETPLFGVNGRSLANVFVQVPRAITMRSGFINTIARNTFIFGSIAALLFMLLILQRIVVTPIEAIREHTERITEEGLDASRLVIAKNDEFGELAVAFDRMTLRLTETQNKLADASHAAGMSQVADTVIHNVGNVLTNVNSLIDTATDRVTQLRVQPLDKLAKRLQSPDVDDEMRAAAPKYLDGLAGALENDRVELSELLTTLSDNVNHIHDVIRDQRRHTLNTVNTTRFSVQGIIDEAIGCCRARLDQDRISVTVPTDVSIGVEADRSLLLQIVINIIGNARHAIRESGSDSPSLTIKYESTAERIRILFCDSGCGMSAETLKRIFEAHFTTRNSGSGLGLHFCAIAMKRMGGSISASSDGEGQGSTFALELPRLNQQVPVIAATSLTPATTMIGSNA